MIKNIIIIGASEPGFEILDIVKEINNQKKQYEFLGFFDEYKKGRKIFNSFKNLEKINSNTSEVYFVNSIGNVFNRKRTTNEFKEKGFKLEKIISPQSYISKNSQISQGVIIFPNVSISYNTKIGENVLVNYNCSISHGCSIGENCNISPGCHISGNVKISKNCFLGTGVTIIPEIIIKSEIYIGAGATITKNLKKSGIYVGIPARYLRSNTNER